MNYTQDLIKKQYFIDSFFCTKNKRCNNYKECPECSKIYRKREYSKALNHITENSIKQYKNKCYLVFKSNLLNVTVEEKNSNLDLFIKDFLAMKRNKNFFINKDSQYFINKEISFNKAINEYNPHLNIILLDNRKIDTNNKQLQELMNKHSITIYKTNIIKTKKRYLTSIQKLINYFLKFDKNRASLEKISKLTKFKRNIFKSDLFIADKFEELRKRLYIHIKELKKHYNGKIREARSILLVRKHLRNTKYYFKLLKSFRKKREYYERVLKNKIIYYKKKQFLTPV